MSPHIRRNTRDAGIVDRRSYTGMNLTAIDILESHDIGAILFLLAQALYSILYINVEFSTFKVALATIPTEFREETDRREIR